MSQIFDQKLEQIGIVLTETQKQQFDKFYELLVEWNKVMNLTGITEYEEVNEKHFVDSLSIVKAVDMNQVSSVIDVGTGAVTDHDMPKSVQDTHENQRPGALQCAEQRPTHRKGTAGQQESSAQSNFIDDSLTHQQKRQFEKR